jgi:hypothetical protein
MVGVTTQNLSRIPGRAAQVVDDGGSGITVNRRGIQSGDARRDGCPSTS